MQTEPARSGSAKAGRRRRVRLASFGRDRDGATAVEFALVAGPFFFALLATMEIAMVLWTSEVLEKAVATASRKIYTGEFQGDTSNAGKTNPQLQAKVKALVCDEVSPLVSCDDVAVDVRDFSSFGSAAPPDPVTKTKTWDTSSFGYKPVAAKQIGLVTAAVEYKTFFPALSGGKLANGNRAVVATAAFRTEPFSN